MVLIPSHREYTDETRKLLWRGREEIKRNAKRNYIERCVEGKNWRTVFEEKDMFMDIQRGVRVHPCWVNVHRDVASYENNRGGYLYRRDSRRGSYNDKAYRFVSKYGSLSA